MNLQSTSSLTYPGILRRASRGILVLLLACMPWATLFPAASPPSRWAALMEGLQHFSPLRTGSWEDVAINARGCLAGVLLFAVLAGAVLRTFR